MDNVFFSYVLLAAVGALVGVSQVMLKISARKPHANIIREYLNAPVIGSYAILFATTFLNMLAMRHLPYKVVSAFTCLPYVAVVLLSRLVLKERISARKWWGLAVISAGIIIFSL